MPTNQMGQTIRGGPAMHPLPINQPYLQQQFQPQPQVNFLKILLRLFLASTTNT